MNGSLVIRPAEQIVDGEAVWAILEPIIRAGETFALPRDWSRERALDGWFAPAHRVFVAQEPGAVLGTFYIRPNQLGGGDHVANASFATHPAATGRGIARAMGRHAFEAAKAAGFCAMQFNLVVASNTRALPLWRGLGMAEIGRLPGVFRHPSLGLVDALVMHRAL